MIDFIINTVYCAGIYNDEITTNVIVGNNKYEMTISDNYNMNNIDTILNWMEPYKVFDLNVLFENNITTYNDIEVIINKTDGYYLLNTDEFDDLLDSYNSNVNTLNNFNINILDHNDRDLVKIIQFILM